MFRTINKLIDEDKVVLHGLLIHLSKVRLANVDEPIAKLENQRRIRVTPTLGSVFRRCLRFRRRSLGDSQDIYVVCSNMEETCRSKGYYW